MVFMSKDKSLPPAPEVILQLCQDMLGVGLGFREVFQSHQAITKPYMSFPLQNVNSLRRNF